MKIALGADHGGYALKEEIKKMLERLGHTYEDFGCFSTDSCDYPDFGAAAAGLWLTAAARWALWYALQELECPSWPIRSPAFAVPTAPILWRRK